MGEPRVDTDGTGTTEPPSMRALSPGTITALVEAVDGAKARGWTQNDLKQWFEGQGVASRDFFEGKKGREIQSPSASLFAQVSITGLPDLPPPRHQPNPEHIRQHIEWLTEPARGDYDDALFEIAWDGDGRGPTSARLFGMDEVGEAVSFAAARNAEGRNLYIGAALRQPDTPRQGRASGVYFYVATAVPIDIDTDYDATRTRMATACDDGLVVTTGLTPTRRSQHWTRLREPCDDEADFGHAFAALVSATGADMKVKDSARIMRLGGTVSYPDGRKRANGYQIEVTSVSVRPDARATDIERLKALEPTIARGERSAVDRPAGSANEIERDGFGKVTDGREAHFRNLLVRHLSHYQKANGADPDAQELFEAAYADFTRPGAVDNADGRWTCEEGRRALLGRARNTLNRLRQGRLARAGLYSIDTEEGRDEAEAVQARREADYRERQAVGIVASPAAIDAAAGLAHTLIRPTPYAWIDPSRIPPRDVLYGKHYYRKFLSATVSPGGIGKSTNGIVEGLAMVTGRDLLGEAPTKPLRVWYWNGEDPMEELQRRIAAACLHYKIQPGEIDGRLFVDSGRDTEIVIARESRDGIDIAIPLVDALIEQIRSAQIDVLIIDPFVASHAVSENDNTKIEAVVRQWMRVADEGACAVELIHHVRKSNGQNETTVDDARGAGALLAKVRSARVLNAMSKTEAQEVGIEEKERFGFFRVDIGKANLAPRGDPSAWRRMVGVPLGNRVDAMEDEVGVTTLWRKPDMFADLKDHHRAAVVAMVQNGQWREDIRASNWVGHAVAAVMGLNTQDEKDKHKAKAFASMWIKTGVLKVVQGLDDKRRMRAFVIAEEID